MLKRLRTGAVAGVIIHKVDRSARNLKDWADIGQLMDDGVQVHFAHESLDMASSSGRLAADVQAVVAANYVRNLREETKKGFYGRLKQGLYPMPAPLGYLDAGAGKPKIIDPVRGPLVVAAFRLYATGRYSQRTLQAELHQMGLRTRRGEEVSRNTLAGILSNTFYHGLIQIRGNGQSFAGKHETLISRTLFERVQDVLHGRTVQARSTREYLFSRLIRCSLCGRSLVGETQKGYVYYRCHTLLCPTTGFREESIDASIRAVISRLKLQPLEVEILDSYVAEKQLESASLQTTLISTLKLKLLAVEDRLGRLTDAYIDGRLDPAAFEQRKKTLLSERLEYEHELRAAETDHDSAHKKLVEFVELVKHAYLLYEYGTGPEKRSLMQMALSNRSAARKNLDVTLISDLSAVANRHVGQSGGPSAGRVRTFWKKLIDERCDPGKMSDVSYSV